MTSDNLLINSPIGLVAIDSSANFLVDQSADIRGLRIVVNEGANVEVGDLSLTTRAGGSVTINSDIQTRLVAGTPTNPTGGISITSPDVFLGSDSGSESLVWSEEP